jgi:hypothetical protein
MQQHPHGALQRTLRGCPGARGVPELYEEVKGEECRQERKREKEKVRKRESEKERK